MRKKYLSALLFGALVMASTATFTSCKDYDDDIDQVNTNINAVKSDLSSKMDAVNTSISGLTSAQSEIKSSLSAVNKQIETLSADGAKAVAALKAELQKADADQKAALEDQIARLTAQLEAQLVSLNTQAAQLTAQQAQIETILAELEATKAGIEAANAKLDKAEAELKAGIAANSQDIAALNERLTTALNEIATAFENKIDTELAIVQAQISALETVQTNHDTSIESMLVVLDGISGQIAAINGQLDTINGSVGENTAAIEALKATIDTLKQEMEEKIVASHDKIREEIAAVDTKLGAEIEVVKNDLAALAGKLAAQKADFDLQLAALVEYQEGLAAADIDHDGRITANASAIAGNAAAIEANKVSIEENKVAAEQAIAELKAVLTEKIEGLEAEYAQKIADITANHDALQAIVESLQGDVEGIHSSITDILAGITEINGGINEIIDCIGGIEEDIDLIDNEIIGMLVSIGQLQSFQAELNDRLIVIEAFAASKEDVAANAQAIQELVAELSAAKSALETSIADSNAALKGELGKDIQDLADRVSQLQIGANDQDWEGIKALVNDAKTELTSAINTAKTDLTSAYQAADQVLEGKINTLETTLRTAFGNDLVTLTSSVNTMVTNVAFATEDALDDYVMTLQTVKENAATFGGANMVGTPIKNTITFTQDKQYQVGDAFYIRVSPASATVTPDMISLVNTKGGNLDGIVKITSVDRLEDVTDAPLARATNAPSGIWKVSVEAVDYNAESFDIVTKNAAGRPILFAVSINSKSGNNEEESRTVNTAFDLTFNNAPYAVASTLDFTVNGTDVNTIRNRKADKTWTLAPALTVTDTNTAATDDRRALPLLPAVQSENITVKLPAAATNVRAMYVTLDYANVNATDPSELQAWKTYEYEGLDEIVETKDSNEINIKVSSTAAIKDEIGFRVFAVNYDGTLVDPDGKAFYVKLGNDGVTIPAANTVIYANNTVWNAAGTGMPTATYSLPANAFNIATLDNTASIEWKANGPVNTNRSGLRQYNGFSVRLLAADNTAIFATDRNSASQTVTATSGFTATQLKNVKKVETCFYHSMPTMLDGTKLDGTLIFKDADGFVLATLEVSATKQLPTAAPDGFSVKAGQIVNGIHYAYLTPSALSGGFGTATVGIKDMNNVFNGWNANYQIVFDNAADDGNGNWNQPWTDDANISIPTVLVDSETQHPTKVQYKYSGVSTYVDQNGDYLEGENHVITVRDFNTVFGCIFDKSTWSWATGEEMGYTWNADDQKWYIGRVEQTDVPTGKLTYASQVTVKATQIFSHNSVDGTYTKSLEVLRQNDLNFVKAYITSNETGNKDYFVDATYSDGVMTFAVNSTSSNPQHEVPSTLHIEYKDQFGHINVIDIPVTILPQ